MNTIYQECNTDTRDINHSTKDTNNLRNRALQKTREIVIRADIPRRHSVEVWTGWVSILSIHSKFEYNPKIDLNNGILRNLKNTKNIVFSILDRTSWEFQQLEIPISLSEKIWEYLRNMQAIESDEWYRLPGWLKEYPVNCQSFVYYIKWWFTNKPKLSFKYLRTEEDGKNILPWDVLHIHEWDEWSWEYWHYMIYLWDGYCISKNGHANIVITRHFIEWLYLVTEK